MTTTINWEEIEVMRTELDRLTIAIKECQTKGEYVEKLPLLRQHEKVSNTLKQKVEEAKKTADKNVRKTLEEMLVFVLREYIV